MSLGYNHWEWLIDRIYQMGKLYSFLILLYCSILRYKLYTHYCPLYYRSFLDNLREHPHYWNSSCPPGTLYNSLTQQC